MSRSRSTSPMPDSCCSSPYTPALHVQQSRQYQSLLDVAPRWYLNGEELMHDCPFGIDTCTGCDGTLSESHVDDETDRYSVSSAFFSNKWDRLSKQSATTASSIGSSKSLKSDVLQYREEFLRSYFPAGISDHETDFIYSKLLARESLESMSPTMHVAVDTLGLIQLGTSQSDPGLIRKAQAKYQEAVAALNIDLEDPDAMFDDGVLGTIYILGFCEMYEPLTQDTPIRTHHRGLRNLLIERGPEGHYSNFAQLLVYNFRHWSAITGCAERKTVPFVGEKWRRCSAITDCLTTALSERVLVIPSVLERADRAMHRSRRNTTELSAILLELSSFEHSMLSWMVSWYSSFEHQPYWQTRVEEFDHFKQHRKTAPVVFQKALVFQSFSTASLHATYWIALLALKHTICNVGRSIQQHILAKTEAVLLAEGNEYADRLCESVAWLSQERYGLCGLLRAMEPLQYALNWYTLQITPENLAKMAWCDKICKSMRSSNALASNFLPASGMWSTQPYVTARSPETDLELLSDRTMSP